MRKHKAGLIDKDRRALFSRRRRRSRSLLIIVVALVFLFFLPEDQRMKVALFLFSLLS